MKVRPIFYGSRRSGVALTRPGSELAVLAVGGRARAAPSPRWRGDPLRRRSWRWGSSTRPQSLPVTCGADGWPRLRGRPGVAGSAVVGGGAVGVPVRGGWVVPRPPDGRASDGRAGRENRAVTWMNPGTR
ncbi:hypothetical protein Arub01_34280 [Actinomadura rubrobrunea]|uniref:Uncharacterized protein n=1 Tax=Actinomadura rubrobrunea TaxID=115335 RepID=A0A9W6PY55_9ACTN|nr:hypothetical protein Arub01_34280 [Actinomadura rubrobrunea]